ncbi:hypothetical protein Dred_2803 [Desulforamulus reducens MI-1]|uniref:DUF2508 family protein n=1 Tax=Desulforamulus reducens (strain ATCC BAA-1160 / DSM 100696 / MI-1) TaxID=349161 RepID=A4J8A4_DESRM|nr:DUF2508 family protein [Desulforamulus reducens]ABO51307.1 hypothetical protein Dred_2803 [Desulforamulus reducens MI-1]
MKIDKEILFCMIKGFSWHKLKDTVLVKKVDHNSLAAQIEQAKRAWFIAQNQMEWADRDMLEAAILHTTACERRYMALLQKARNNHYITWQEKELAPVVISNS